MTHIVESIRNHTHIHNNCAYHIKTSSLRGQPHSVTVTKLETTRNIPKEERETEDVFTLYQPPRHSYML